MLQWSSFYSSNIILPLNHKWFITSRTLTDNNTSAKVAFLHSFQLYVSKNSTMPYDRQLPNEFTTTYVIIVSYLSGGIFTFKIKS